MKYKILYILIILSVIFSCDKEEFFSGQAESFIKYFGSDKPYTGVQVLAIEGGGYIVMGNFESSGRSQDICLIRTDKYGNTIGPILVYGGLYDDYGYSIKKNNAGYIIAGSTKKSRLGDTDVYLIQIDNKGDTLWTKSFGSDYGYDDEAYDVLVLENQELILTGYTKVSESNSNLLVAKTSSLGISEWFYGYGLTYNEIGNTVIKAGDYFIIGGSRKSGASEGSAIYGYLVQVTLQGTNPLPKSFDVEGESEVSSLVKGGDNTYYAACTIFLQGAESKISIVKFQHDNRDRIEVLWEKEYGEQMFNQASYIKANNNSLTIVGTAGISNEMGDLLLMNLDREGNEAEYFYIGDGISFTGMGFDFTFDGGYVITGSNFSNENPVITLAKLNSGGNL